MQRSYVCASIVLTTVVLVIYVLVSNDSAAARDREDRLVVAIKNIQQSLNQNKESQFLGDLNTQLGELGAKVDKLSQQLQTLKDNGQSYDKNQNTELDVRLSKISDTLAVIQESSQNTNNNDIVKKLDELSYLLVTIEELASNLENEVSKPDNTFSSTNSKQHLPPLVEYQMLSSRNVFFDLGANIGDTTLFFTGVTEVAMGGDPIHNIDGVPLRIKGPWDIHMYEAHPKFNDKLVEVKSTVEKLDPAVYGGPFHVFCNNGTAIGWVDGETEFFLDVKSKATWGSSLLASHPDVNTTRSKEIKVPLHNLARVIMSYRISDYIIVKMDIEGIEYDLLAELAIQGAFPFIDELYVEWHSFGVNEKSCNNGVRYHLIEKAKKYMKYNAWH